MVSNGEDDDDDGGADGADGGSVSGDDDDVSGPQGKQESAVGGGGTGGRPKIAESADPWKDAKSMYEFSAKDIDGNEVSLEKYKCGLLKNILHNP
ncbi:unnamed protein product [Lampetra planeri]